MGVIAVFFIIAIVIALIATVAVFLNRWYQRNLREPTTEKQFQFDLPKHFTPALLILLIGFHLGLYTFLTYLGPIFQAPAAGGLVFSLSMTLVWLLLQPKKSLFVISLTVLNLLLGISLFFRANGFVQSWSTILFLGTQVALLVMLVSSQAPTSVGEWLNSLWQFILLTIRQVIRLLSSMFRSDLKSNTTLLSWLKTLLFTFVVLLVFIGLLSQADPVFAEIVREFHTQLFGRVVWSIVLIVLAISWWTLPVSKRTETKTEAGWASFRDVAAVLSIVVAITGIFLAVQFQYLFNGTTDMLVTLHLTFSEYVRQGFTELLLAVLFGGSIAYLAGTRVRFWQGRERLLTRALNSVMLLELCLLLVSAFRRNYLYVSSYGLTRVRVIGDIFLLWLTLFLVILLAYGWQKLKEKTALSLLWTGALLVILAINLFNVDKMVVDGAPSHHEYTDYFYLLQLSEDAGAEWPQLMAKVHQDTAALVAKPNLSDEEKAQLAGLKLATISFIENRDFLFLKYAPEKWLLDSYTQIGLNLASEDPRSPVIDTVFPSQSALAIRKTLQNPTIPSQLKKLRSWTFWNYAEAQTYKLLSSQEVALSSRNKFWMLSCAIKSAIRLIFMNTKFACCGN